MRLAFGKFLQARKTFFLTYTYFPVFLPPFSLFPFLSRLDVILPSPRLRSPLHSGPPPPSLTSLPLIYHASLSVKLTCNAEKKWDDSGGKKN